MLSIADCRSHLNEELSFTLSDEEITSLRDCIQEIAEVLVEHSLA
jgi:hypothetical protein